MFERIRRLLAENGILLSAPLALSDCNVKKAYLLDKAGIGMSGTAVIFAIPYHTPACEDASRNLSRYAVGRDYHIFIKELEARLLPALTAEFPDARFALFADHSPIDEREAAAKAELGILGKNGLLITKPYSSYVFLGELITDAPLPPNQRHVGDVTLCRSCGACLAVCPMMRGETDGCLSALTQKKGTLTVGEMAAVRVHGSIWGCDLCQEICPYTQAAIRAGTVTTPVGFFHKSPLPHLTYDGILSMSDAEFSERAYAWRGREVILRNLEITERENEGEQKNDRGGERQ